jgi:hypothetical protein
MFYYDNGRRVFAFQTEWYSGLSPEKQLEYDRAEAQAEALYGDEARLRIPCACCGTMRIKLYGDEWWCPGCNLFGRIRRAEKTVGEGCGCEACQL